MSECLHCEINDLVQQHIDRGDSDLAELASMVVESLAELILLAPESEQPRKPAKPKPETPKPEKPGSDEPF